MTTRPGITTDQTRALTLIQAADWLRDAHARGMSMQEIGSALRNTADEADPMVASLARDGLGLDEIATMLAAPMPQHEAAPLPAHDNLYICPLALQIESPTHGGFDTCCDRPDLHVPVPTGPGTDALSRALDALSAPTGDSGADGDDAFQPGEPRVQVGWYCWRCRGMNTQACRSDCVPVYVPREWATEMEAEIARRENGDDEDDDPQPGESLVPRVLLDAIEEREAEDRDAEAQLAAMPDGACAGSVPLRAELSPTALLADEDAGSIPETEALHGGRRLNAPASPAGALRDQIAKALIDWADRTAPPAGSTRLPDTVRTNAYSRAGAVLPVVEQHTARLREELQQAQAVLAPVRNAAPDPALRTRVAHLIATFTQGRDGWTSTDLAEHLAPAIEVGRAALLDRVEKSHAELARASALHADTERRLRAARFVEQHWRDRFTNRTAGRILPAAAAHALALVRAALDGQSDPGELGLDDHVHDAFRAALGTPQGA
ncbi:hypothetical protein [Streptomyces synnematoformans]|uniref:Uncharacterized protein n=1 Tax=Streptomyces synnematoformans TaxID=415721 RepID=A0ABN2XAI9_9ACTN